MSITFNNVVFQAGFVGEDDGNPASSFGIDAANTSPITINGTVTKVGDTVLAYGTLPGQSDTGITTNPTTLTVTQYDNPNQILFSAPGQNGAAGEPFRFVLSNTQNLSADQTKVSFAADPALNSGSGTDVYAAPCYATGTRVRTARDGVERDVAVEALAVGDVAVTASGQHRPIRWIGSRRIDCRGHRAPHDVLPVRIRAHAFGPARPARDIVVSPGHALCLDLCGEVLVPAISLLNGSTIVQEPVDAVTYWHVELEGGHDILLAENLPAESYLDMGNRGFFAGTTGGGPAGATPVELAALPDAARCGGAAFCRPFAATGVLIEAARERLNQRAAALGWMLEVADPLAGMHLVVDGRRIAPAMDGLAARFALPAGEPGEAWLVSEAARPCDVGAGADFRRLGLRLAGLGLVDGAGARRAIALDHPSLGEGWHRVEGDAGAPTRWTDGRARLPATLWQGGAAALVVELARHGLPRWTRADDGAVGRRA